MGKSLVTGGAGFVGCNLAASLLRCGESVVVLDSLVRLGSERNLDWLESMGTRGQLRVLEADVRDFEAVGHAVRDVDVVFHLAGQVAVTSSVEDPRSDFEVNALGTVNVLEAARAGRSRPIVVFASTNKVYGAMEDVAVVEKRRRYEYRDLHWGVPESQPLDFHSPYGCSKGAADQYVRDYGRIYGIPTVVFRMSCTYGPRQFGNEDQGWVAHFMISTAQRRPITIYGDGKQVRDILFVDDLVRAFRLAAERIDVTAGEVYNIGGGPGNTVSVWAEFGEVLAELCESGNGDGRVPVSFRAWRAGDQPCYVSDIRKAARDLGWAPAISKEAGLERLWAWVHSNSDLLSSPVRAAAANTG
jgi:CDP-paratose 2-epimerase